MGFSTAIHQNNRSMLNKPLVLGHNCRLKEVPPLPKVPLVGETVYG